MPGCSHALPVPPADSISCRLGTSCQPGTRVLGSESQEKVGMSSNDEQHTHESSDHGDGSGVAAQSQNSGVGQLDRTPGNVDKIREILFGANMREYAARFV